MNKKHYFGSASKKSKGIASQENDVATSVLSIHFLTSSFPVASLIMHGRQSQMQFSCNGIEKM